MFNGLDELEDFADQLAPLTPEELAAVKKKQAAARTETESAENEPVPDTAPDRAVVQEAAAELGTVAGPYPGLHLTRNRRCSK
jgi:hypothetical protein